MKGMKIGIDFGSSSIKIFAEGKGIVVDEPSIAAVDIETNKPIAFGVSPFGIWQNKSNSPYGSYTAGKESYSLLYAGR